MFAVVNAAVAVVASPLSVVYVLAVEVTEVAAFPLAVSISPLYA